MTPFVRLAQQIDMDPVNSHHPRQVTWEMFDRYLAGDASLAEADLVRAAIDRFPWMRDRLHNPETYHESGRVEHRALRSPSWEAMQRRMGDSGAAGQAPLPSAHTIPGTAAIRPVPFVTPGHRSLRDAFARVRWAMMTTCVVGTLALLAGWHWGTARMATTLASQSFTYTTAGGKQATIRLPDGSTVLLNVASRLDVPSDFAAGNRTVSLEGEAFFQVTHHAGSPFTVIAGESRTRVLGTSFVVRRYKLDTAAVVAVGDGKVEVQSTVLTAQQQVTVGRTGVSSVQRVTPALFGFTRGTMMLDRVSLRDAVRDLERWYGAEIRIAEPALEGRLLTLEVGEGSLADLSSVLELALRVRIERDGRILTIFSR